ncbi:hypothetical protein Cgig2_027699 [Carnegiea gigantea]|uniref:Uncharacterized protein n=1 Tax=Carnegiea gigantea TaxID=171969 RepID=A0A9Q1JU49_9CARY|nr:hypothetical protein Cgig2_027699 [Carnegiea gigantea]
MRKPRPKSKNKKGKPRKQAVTSEVGPSTSQGRESTNLGAGPSNSQPTIVTTTSTSPRRFTRQPLLQPQKSKAKKQRTGQSFSQPPLTIRDSSPNTTTPSPSQPLSNATAEHRTNATHIDDMPWSGWYDAFIPCNNKLLVAVNVLFILLNLPIASLSSSCSSSKHIPFFLCPQQESPTVHTTIVWPHEVFVRSRNTILHFRWSPTFGIVNLSFWNLVRLELPPMAGQIRYKVQ